MLNAQTFSNRWEDVIWNAPNAPEINKVIYDGVTVWERGGLSLLRDFNYTLDESTNTVTLTSWKNTYRGTNSTICYVPDIGSDYTVNLGTLNFRTYGRITNIFISDSTVMNYNIVGKFTAMNNLAYCYLPYDKVTDMFNTFHSCKNLLTGPYSGNNVTNMRNTYYNASRLTGNPVCGPNVTDMSRTYGYCFRLTGEPVCGDLVTLMNGTYIGCRNITGNPVCGPNVNDFAYAYYDCTNITGNPVCSNTVTSLLSTYHNCTNISGSPVCGPNVTTIQSTYFNCPNIYGNGYFYSPNIRTITGCFNGRNTSNRLNLYIPANSVTFNMFTNSTTSAGLYGRSVNWTNDYAANGVYYNTTYNTYIYPVANVEEARLLNGD